MDNVAHRNDSVFQQYLIVTAPQVKVNYCRFISFRLLSACSNCVRHYYECPRTIYWAIMDKEKVNFNCKAFLFMYMLRSEQSEQCVVML